MNFNTTIAYAGVRYEVYWTSQYAEHILNNFPDPRHGVKHTEIVRILQVAGYVEKTKKRGLYLFVSEYEDKMFETYVYFVPVSSLRPAHCVIVTCYRSGRLKRKLAVNVVAS